MRREEQPRQRSGLRGTDAEKRSPGSAVHRDKELVERLLAGDQRAFEVLADDYIPALYRFALFRLNRDQDLAEEISQATLVKVMTKLSSFRGEATLMTWICACCRMEIAAHFRRQGRRPREVELPDEGTLTDAPLHGSSLEGPDRFVFRRESMELVHAALDQLPPHYGRVLEWKYLEDIPVKEIARRLSTTAKAAESMLTRARDAFRDVYARQLNGPELRLVRS